MRTPFVIGLVLFAVLLLGLLMVAFTRPAKPKHVTLNYWGLWEDQAVFQPLIDQYQSAHPDVTINYLPQSPTEYRQRLQANLSQGTGPDIFRFHNTWVPILGNFLSPVPQAIYSAAEFAATFYPAAVKDLSRGGQLFGIPLEFDGLAMVVNQKILQEKGKSIPTNWDELRQTAVAITRCDTPDGRCTSQGRITIAGAALGSPDNVDHWPDILSLLLLQNGVNPAQPQGQAAEDVLEFFTGFVTADRVWNNSLPTSTAAFINGQVGIIFVPARSVSTILNRTAGFKVGVYPVPQVPFDPARGETATSWASYWVEGVNKNSPQAAAAWAFLKFLSSKESLTQLSLSTPRSRIDLSGLSLSQYWLAPFVLQAPTARSWYLTSVGIDGPTGINTRFTSLYSAALTRLLTGGSNSEALKTIQEGTSQILADYGLAPRLSPSSR